MRWRDMRSSDNLEDHEGAGPPGRGLGGGVMLGGGGLIAVVVISRLLGLNPLDVLVSLQSGGAPSAPTQNLPSPPASGPAARDETKEFVVRILGDTEDTWSTLFGQMGGEYRPPRLVLFRGAVDSACGAADSRVYLDRSFFEDLAQRFGALGEFARAYVIAHEIGHHVQNQLGTTEKGARQRARAGATESNPVSVQLELQADCFAGVWGHFARRRNLLEPGDVESGLAAAAAIGDDRIERQSRSHVSPESFTHGSSAQRVRWFRAGLDSGDVRQCNTFATARP